MPSAHHLKVAPIDTLGRRARNMPRSTGALITLRQRDLFWFEKIHRHGALTTAHLVAYSDHLGMAQNRAIDRMGALFHEERTPHKGTYFARPHQQWQTFNPFNQPLVHDITARAETALKEAGTYREHAPSHGVGMQWKHEFMLASFTASIELAVLKRSDELEYLFHDEICARIGSSLRFKVGKETLKPDRAFGIRYKKTGAVRLFLVEADRTTEPVTGSTYRKTYADNLRLYRDFIGDGIYKTAMKYQGGVVILNLLTSPGHKVNVMRVLSEMTEGKGNNYMAFHVLPEYGYHFQPVPPKMQLLSAPYERVGRPPFFIDKE